jgi:hypothetical protein
MSPSAASRLRWLWRGCWLTAWGVWIWLGVGLHRELPRELGSPIATLPREPKSQFVGFVNDTNRFAVLRRAEPVKSTIEIFNAEDGSLATTILGPGHDDYLWPCYYLERHGVMLAKEHGELGKAWATGLHVLDLETGRWRRVTESRIHSGSAHLHMPWVVLVEGDGSAGPRRIVVVDWKTCERKVVQDLPRGCSTNGHVFFLSDSDRVVVPLRRTSGWPFEQTDEFVEVWRLTPTPTLDARIEPFPAIQFESVAGGRVAFASPNGTPAVDVYDFDEQRFVFSNPPRDQRAPPARGTWWDFGPMLSASGRYVHGGNPQALWEVDSGTPVWQSGDLTLVEPSTNSLLCFERWDVHWRSWLPSLQYRTILVRDMDTGRTIVRTAPSKVTIQPRFWNAARTLAVGNDGGVYRLPLEVDWRLWIIGQTLLATPLIFFWTALWLWRRRMRRIQAAIVPAEPRAAGC